MSENYAVERLISRLCAYHLPGITLRRYFVGSLQSSPLPFAIAENAFNLEATLKRKPHTLNSISIRINSIRE